MALNFIRNAIIINILVVIVCFFYRNHMPNNIAPELKAEPQVMSLNQSAPFELKTQKNLYQITSKKDFQSQALVMGQHSANISPDKDLRVAMFCLTWGENLKNKSYKEIEMSGGQSCSYFYPARSKFQENLLTSNDILSADENIVKKIKKIKNGDQISIKGQLVDYKYTGFDHLFENEPSRHPQHRIIYVSEIKTIKRNPWRFPFYVSILTLVSLIVLWSDLESHYHKKDRPQDEDEPEAI